MEASRAKIEMEDQDPWAYNDESDEDDDDLVVQKETTSNIEMVEALRESNTIEHCLKGLTNPDQSGDIHLQEHSTRPKTGLLKAK
jgi:hypothetical protein